MLKHITTASSKEGGERKVGEVEGRLSIRREANDEEIDEGHGDAQELQEKWQV